MDASEIKRGYVASVIESEAGWGQRPDGYVICIDLEKGKAFATKENGVICGDYSCYSQLAGSFKKCFLTDEGFEIISKDKNGVVWTDKSSSFVLEP